MLLATGRRGKRGSRHVPVSMQYVFQVFWGQWLVNIGIQNLANSFAIQRELHFPLVTSDTSFVFIFVRRRELSIVYLDTNGPNGLTFRKVKQLDADSFI
jgi:hypothetical protein